MYLTNNSPSLCALTLCITFRKINLFLARPQEYQQIQMKIVDL